MRHPVRVTFLESAVAYDGLPISSGGAHSLGRISARNAFDSWLKFLDTCAVASPIQAFFDFPSTPELPIDPAVERRVDRDFPGRPGRCIVPWDRAEEALSLFESLEPLPVNRWGMAPLWLWFTADFRLLRPGSRDLWPGQDPALFGEFVTPTGVSLGACSTRLILQAKRSIGLNISIPDASDGDLDKVVPWLLGALPMRLSSKQWTRWTLTKNRRSYRGRRITPAPLS
jgi:hypothetical protein